MFIMYEYIIYSKICRTLNRNWKGWVSQNVVQKWYMLYLVLIFFDVLRISKKRIFFQQTFLIVKFIMNTTYELFFEDFEEMFWRLTSSVLSSTPPLSPTFYSKLQSRKRVTKIWLNLVSRFGYTKHILGLV